MKKRNILIASGLTLGVIAGATFGKIPVNVMNDNYIQEKYSDISQEDLEGKVIWEKKNVSYNQTGITALKDGVIAVASDGQVVKYDLNGNVLWQNEDVSYSYTGVTTVGDGVIAVAHGGQVVKYDLDGNVVWNKLERGDKTYIYYGVTTIEDGVVAVDSNGKVVKYDLDGNVLWQNKELSNRYGAVTSVENGVIAVAGGRVVKYGVKNPALDKLLEDISKLTETDYSSTSWQDLQDAITGVDTLTKQSEIDSKVSEIQTALNNLGIDRSKLNDLLAEVDRLISTDYSTDSWNKLQEAISNAGTVTTQAQVENAIKEITNAKNNLGVDRSKLDKLLADVSKLNERDYYKDEWNNLQIAISGTDNLTKQSEINSKIVEIQTALDNLGVDKTKLSELLDRIDKMNKDIYTKDSLDSLMKVVDSVEEYTKQYEVDEKVAELEEALKNLKLDPDKVQIQKGDLDKNGIVNANDAAIALDLYKYGNVSDEELLIGDMDNNGIINANDAALILDIYKYGK